MSNGCPRPTGFVPPAPAQMPERQPIRVRAYLRALGFAPDEHQALRTKGQFPGLLIVDNNGRPVRAYTERQIKRLQDEAFFKDVAKALEAEVRAEEEANAQEAKT